MLSSFGKDSLATLDLAARFGVRRVLYLEDRDEAVDALHIATIVKRYALDVTRMESGRAILYFIRGEPMLLGLPFVNRSTMLPIPTNIDPYEHDQPYTCVDDRLSAVHGGTLEYDADLLITGFKLADWDGNTCRVVVDELAPEDKAAYLARYRPVMDIAPGVQMASPLLQWSHADVWDYLDSHGILASPVMYDGQRKRPHLNRVCYRCHDPAGPLKVACPLIGREITNLGPVQADAGMASLQRLGLLTPGEAKGLT